MGWVVNATSMPLYPLRIDPFPVVWKTGLASGPVWMGAENFASTGIRSPDHPASIESLYRLRYLGPCGLRRANVKTVWVVRCALVAALNCL
jgi:hypothetical protein